MINLDPWSAVRYVFCNIFCPCKKERLRGVKVTLRTGSIAVTAQPQGETRMNFTLPDDATASASLAYVDAKGNPARVDGVPVWSASDATVLKVTAAADGMSAQVEPVGPLGAAQLKVEADADLGAGIEPIITLVDVEIVGGKAVAGNVTLTINPTI